MTSVRARRLAVFLLILALGAAAGSAVAPALATARPAPGHAQAARPAPGHPQAGRALAGRAQAASGWLARQMTRGSHFVAVLDGVTYPDQGLTIDAIFAFAATGSANGFGARAVSWLERPGILSNYIGNGTTESYAGATAKVALAAEVRGLNPARFGKVNLLARLARLLKPSGRYSDHSRYGDYSNAFSQSLAIIALSRHSRAPAKAVSFLVSTECKNGGYPLDFAQKTCASDADATAMDVQALLAAGRVRPAERGLAWLEHAQRGNGGFGSTPGAVPNANSTGLAGEAFAVGRWFHRAARAKKFLVSLQVGCSGKTGHRGAIAYDMTGFTRSTATSATAQGILGLADVGLAQLTSRGAHRSDPRLECS
jgi:hypothetical protein